MNTSKCSSENLIKPITSSITLQRFLRLWYFFINNAICTIISLSAAATNAHTHTHRGIVLDGVCPACGCAVRHRWLPFTFHWILCVLLYADVFIIKFPWIFIYIFCVALRYALCLSPPCVAFTILPPSPALLLPSLPSWHSSHLRYLTASSSLPFPVRHWWLLFIFTLFIQFIAFRKLSVAFLRSSQFSLCFFPLPFHTLLLDSILCSSLDSTRAQFV